MPSSTHFNTYTTNRRMITVEYLKELLLQVEGFNDPDNQVKCGDGFDEISAILENIRSIEFPCVVIEDRSSGSFINEDGPVDNYTIALWVMVQQTREEQASNSQLYLQAYTMMKKIAGLLITEQQKGVAQMASLDTRRMPYNKRQGGPNCLGYELLLTFHENIQLSDE